MKIRDINNYFGDMDLFLIDAILKGKIPQEGKVLDIGCGEGRNGIFFINEEYEYLGIDQNASRISLIDYLSKSSKTAIARFQVGRMQEIDLSEEFDVIICSRILHFAENEQDFQLIWRNIVQHLNTQGVLYFSMDSAMIGQEVKAKGNGKYEFQDGHISYALNPSLYEYMLKGFSELEYLKTVIYNNKRINSFGLLRKD
ncbi:MAG: methyltransferase domain-containing protein [Bacteroidota bacterium]